MSFTMLLPPQTTTTTSSSSSSSSSLSPEVLTLPLRRNITYPNILNHFTTELKKSGESFKYLINEEKREAEIEKIDSSDTNHAFAKDLYRFARNIIERVGTNEKPSEIQLFLTRSVNDPTITISLNEKQYDYLMMFDYFKETLQPTKEKNKYIFTPRDYKLEENDPLPLRFFDKLKLGDIKVEVLKQKDPSKPVKPKDIFKDLKDTFVRSCKELSTIHSTTSTESDELPDQDIMDTIFFQSLLNSILNLTDISPVFYKEGNKTDYTTLKTLLLEHLESKYKESDADTLAQYKEVAGLMFDRFETYILDTKNYMTQFMTLMSDTSIDLEEEIAKNMRYFYILQSILSQTQVQGQSIGFEDFCLNLNRVFRRLGYDNLFLDLLQQSKIKKISTLIVKLRMFKTSRFWFQSHVDEIKYDVHPDLHTISISRDLGDMEEVQEEDIDETTLIDSTNQLLSNTSKARRAALREEAKNLQSVEEALVEKRELSNQDQQGEEELTFLQSEQYQSYKHQQTEEIARKRFVSFVKAAFRGFVDNILIDCIHLNKELDEYLQTKAHSSSSSSSSTDSDLYDEMIREILNNLTENTETFKSYMKNYSQNTTLIDTYINLINLQLNELQSLNQFASDSPIGILVKRIQKWGQARNKLKANADMNLLYQCEALENNAYLNRILNENFKNLKVKGVIYTPDLLKALDSDILDNCKDILKNEVYAFLSAKGYFNAGVGPYFTLQEDSRRLFTMLNDLEETTNIFDFESLPDKYDITFYTEDPEINLQIERYVNQTMKDISIINQELEQLYEREKTKLSPEQHEKDISSGMTSLPYTSQILSRVYTSLKNKQLSMEEKDLFLGKDHEHDQDDAVLEALIRQQDQDQKEVQAQALDKEKEEEEEEEEENVQKIDPKYASVYWNRLNFQMKRLSFIQVQMITYSLLHTSDTSNMFYLLNKLFHYIGKKYDRTLSSTSLSSTSFNLSEKPSPSSSSSSSSSSNKPGSDQMMLD